MKIHRLISFIFFGMLWIVNGREVDARKGRHLRAPVCLCVDYIHLINTILVTFNIARVVRFQPGYDGWNGRKTRGEA